MRQLLQNFKIALTFIAIFTTYQSLAQVPGTKDVSFNLGGSGANNAIYASAVQSNGKIVVAGNFTAYNGVAANRIARINADGSIDNSFSAGGGANQSVLTIVVQSDGKIVIGGDFTSYNGTSRNRIARLNSDGTLDGGFDPGTGANSSVKTLTFQVDSLLLIGGSFTSFDGVVRNRVARLGKNGALDMSFDPFLGADNTINTAVLHMTRMLIIGGEFTSYNGVSRNYITRLNSNGSLNTSLNIGSGMNNSINAIAIQSNGRIIVAGSFTSFNGIVKNKIVRLSSDGSLDATFDAGIGPNAPISSIGIQPNAKIVLGGDFTSFNGISRNGIARLNYAGTLDATFDVGTGFTGNLGSGATRVNSIGIVGEDKIIVTGDFSTYNGVSSNGIIQINAGKCSSPMVSAISGLKIGLCPAGNNNVIYTVNNTPGFVYDWVAPLGANIDNGQGTNSIVMSFTPTFVANPGTLKVTSKNICGEVSMVKSLKLSSIPAMPGMISGATIFCPGQINMPFSISPAVGTTSYTWTMTYGLIASGNGTASILANPAGSTEYVKVAANNACGSSAPRSLKLMRSTCSIAKNEDISSIQNVLIYPNHILKGEQVSLAFTLLDESNNSILYTIEDLSGRLIQAETVYASPGNNTLNLSTQNLNSGMYIVGINVNGLRLARKLIVE